MRCRFCGSTALHNDTQRKNFSGGKAVAGAVMFGAVGAAAGFIGKDVAGWRCGACGQFMAEPMEFFLETQINDAVRKAESGEDLTMFRYYQEQFPNVQARLPAAPVQTVHVPVERPTLPAKKDDKEKADPVKRCYEPGVWQPDCPIFVEAVTIRTRGGEDQLSLSAVNLSEKAVRSAYFQAVVYDDTGDEITRRQCVYQNLTVSGGDAPTAQKRLPEDKTFPLGTDLAHRVDLICEKVAFADDEVWRAAESPETVTLAAQPILSAESFPRYNYIQSKYRDSEKDAPLRMPLEEDGFWLCDCGHPVKKDAACPFCGDTLPELQEAFSQKNLEALQITAVKERAAKRAAFSQKAYADALEAENQKIYQKALALEKKETSADMRKAIAVWEQIPTYSDVEKHLEQCRKRVTQLEMKESAEKAAAEEAERKAAQKAAEEKRLAEEAAEAARKKRNKLIAILGAAAAVILAAVLVVTKVVIPNGKYNDAVALMEAGDFDAAITAFEAMNGYKDSEQKIVEIEDLKAQKAEEAARAALEQEVQKAEALEKDGKLVEAAMAYGVLAEKDPSFWEYSYALWETIVPHQSIGTDGLHAVGLKVDGTTVAVGSNREKECNVSDWEGIVAIAAGGNFTVGLKADGTVVAVGKNKYGQCDVSDWKNIVAIAADTDQTLGLKADGTVVATGYNNEGQCNVSSWEGIVAISAGYETSFGIKADGTVVAVGANHYGQCDVSEWENIVAIDADVFHTVGLKADGTVVAVGQNKDGQCNVSGWTDIVEIAADTFHTVGLKADGTVVATGSNEKGECNVSGWKDIVAIDAGYNQTLGLKSDGTVVAVGENKFGQCNVSGWTDIRVPNKGN